MEVKTYILAGASGKMAMETAALLKKQGHKVIGISRADSPEGYDMSFKIEAYDFGLFPVIDEPVHGLVYFPGTINLKPFNRLSKDDFTADYQVSSLGAAAFIQAYTGNLKKAGSASVVCISTVAVATGMPFHSSVAMAKGAIEGLCRALAAEFSPKIRVNCIAPSLTDTPLANKFLNTPEKQEASKNRNPMKKIGEAQDIAAAVSFLLSDAAAWITGQVLAVDGGMGKLKI